MFSAGSERPNGWWVVMMKTNCSIWKEVIVKKTDQYMGEEKQQMIPEISLDISLVSAPAYCITSMARPASTLNWQSLTVPQTTMLTTPVSPVHSFIHTVLPIPCQGHCSRAIITFVTVDKLNHSSLEIWLDSTKRSPCRPSEEKFDIFWHRLRCRIFRRSHLLSPRSHTTQQWWQIP